MILQKPTEQLLVVTTMNFTADLVAEELYKIARIKEYVARTYSTAREDIFNIKVAELPEYSVLYKMLYEDKLLDEYTRNATVVNVEQAESMKHENIRQAAKFQVEFYFGQTNYIKDTYLQSHEGHDGWIDLDTINQFPKMKKFKVSTEELFGLLKISTKVDVDDSQEFPNGDKFY